MSWIDALRARLLDPTRDWPVVETHLPALDARGGRLGELAFGDGVQAARALGRPNRVIYRGAPILDLVYDRAGFLVEFVQRRFAFVAIQVRKDKALDDIAGYTAARIDGLRLGDDLTRAQVEAALGVPERDDVDEDETVCWHRRGVLQLDCEYLPDGRLKRVNAYPLPQEAGG